MRLLSSDLIKLLDILNDTELHNGESIAQALGITRTAVGKWIKWLNRLDVDIEATKGKGYKLRKPVYLLNKEKIKKSLNQPVRLDVFESIDSTNDYLIKEPYSNEVVICLAEFQTHGRGRLGDRSWHSPFGQNIYCSCRYPFQQGASEMAGLSFVVGLTVVKVLEQIGIKHLTLKWPNDVLWQGKKLSGILIDIVAETQGTLQAIIGVGLNVNMLSYQGWSSVREILGASQNRNTLVALLINQLLDDLSEFEQEGIGHFLKKWRQYDELAGHQVVLNREDKEIKGKVIGVDEQGRLLLKLPSGQIQSFSSGEVTLKKKGE